MKVLYFSATGNSLYVAKSLGGEAISIPSLMRTDNLTIEDDAVGFVVPVYYGDLPKMVIRFISKATIRTKYLFVIITYGFNLSSAMKMADKRLKDGGLVPAYINKVLQKVRIDVTEKGVLDWLEQRIIPQNRELVIEILDSLDGDEAGIKSITFQVNGENAYGLLKSEMGIHRLVRISPFNAAGKRQTSFVSCDVMPDIEEDVDIEVKDEDIRIDTYRSSGAGGQHINKTSSAIRITHFPTGIVVTCQNERSQFQNKDKAMQMLKARLLMLKMEENREKAAGIRGEVKEIGWGSQIRSYVFQPYTMVKDLRTGQETGNVQAVMDGDLDPFIDAYLKWDSLGRPDRKAMSAD